MRRVEGGEGAVEGRCTGDESGECAPRCASSRAIDLDGWNDTNFVVWDSMGTALASSWVSTFSAPRRPAAEIRGVRAKLVFPSIQILGGLLAHMC